jgi:hypothetical protein
MVLLHSCTVVYVIKYFIAIFCKWLKGLKILYMYPDCLSLCLPELLRIKKIDLVNFYLNHFLLGSLFENSSVIWCVWFLIFGSNVLLIQAKCWTQVSVAPNLKFQDKSPKLKPKRKCVNSIFWTDLGILKVLMSNV